MSVLRLLKLRVFSENLEFSRKLGVFLVTRSFLGNLEFSRKLGTSEQTSVPVIHRCHVLVLENVFYKTGFYKEQSWPGSRFQLNLLIDKHVKVCGE